MESTDDYKAEKQVLVLLKGHPGCGKSTFGKAVASRMRWPLVDKDDARDALQAAIVEPHQPPTNKGNDKPLNQRPYHTLLADGGGAGSKHAMRTAVFCSWRVLMVMPDDHGDMVAVIAMMPWCPYTCCTARHDATTAV